MRVLISEERRKDIEKLSVLFNNNKTETVEKLLESTLYNGGRLKFPPREIEAEILLKHINCSKSILERIMVDNLNVSPSFQSNFFLLSITMQEKLLELLMIVEKKYGYTFGTVENLSAYKNVETSNGLVPTLDFYINIKSAVGTVSAHEFINKLKNYTFSGVTNGDTSLPLETIIISRWEHLKNGKNIGSYNVNNLYSRMLNILGLSITTDAFEIDVKGLDRIINNL